MVECAILGAYRHTYMHRICKDTIVAKNCTCIDSFAKVAWSWYCIAARWPIVDKRRDIDACVAMYRTLPPSS